MMVRTMVGTLVLASLLSLSAPAHAQEVPPVVGACANLNLMSPEDLDTLPRVGPVIVGRIVDARTAAPFTGWADADARVKGFGPKVIAKIISARPCWTWEAVPTATPAPTN